MHNLTACLLNINQSELTIGVLDNLARLPCRDWSVQLILVDNGSRREQVQCLSEWFSANKDQFAEVLFMVASRNLGANGGRNVALKLASSDRILILDNDIVLPGDVRWLEKLWKRMDEDPEIGIAGPMLVFVSHPDIVQSTGIGLTDRGRVGYLNRGELVHHIRPELNQVVASPAACWLMNKTAQQSVGFFSDEFYPMQYWDVDFCIRLHLASWKVVCDCSIGLPHIGNVTTRHLEAYPYARTAVQHGMQFRRKWAAVLPQIATLTDADIYWGPIPRGKENAGG